MAFVLTVLALFALTGSVAGPERFASVAIGDFNGDGRVSIEVDGVLVARAAKIGGADLERVISAHNAAASGRTKTQPPSPKGGSITFTVTLTPDTQNSAFLQWISDAVEAKAANGKVSRKSISVIAFNDAGAAAHRLIFSNVWPTKWTGPALNAKSSAHATETIEFVAESYEFK
jgi:phage tail-like protein